jgi:phosphoribosyl-ATP pyrophosphohydrolase
MTDKNTHILDMLAEVIAQRTSESADTSYTAHLLANAPEMPARKLVEEATETLIEAIAGNREKLAEESADLLYHLLVVWQAAGIIPEQVWAILSARQGLSGHAEKASRTSG